jgi:uncharacterized membrane protein
MCGLAVARLNKSRRMIMKTIASVLIGLSVIAGVATQANAQTYGYSAPSTQNHDTRGQ